MSNFIIKEFSPAERAELLKNLNEHEHELELDKGLLPDIPYLDSFYIENRKAVLKITLEEVHDLYDDYVGHHVEQYDDEDFSSDFSSWHEGNLDSEVFIERYENQLEEILSDDLNERIFYTCRDAIEGISC